MIRKIVSPIILFLYGFLLSFLENTLSGFLWDTLGLTSHMINLFNGTSIIFLLIILFLFNILKQSKSIMNVKHKYVYMIMMVFVSSGIAYFWIHYLVWK